MRLVMYMRLPFQKANPTFTANITLIHIRIVSPQTLPLFSLSAYTHAHGLGKGSGIRLGVLFILCSRICVLFGCGVLGLGFLPSFTTKLAIVH